MTPAIAQLKALHLDFEVLEYAPDPSHPSYGLEAAQRLGVSPDLVYKTLIVTNGFSHFVAVVPVTHTLSLKKAAKAFGEKKLLMAAPREAERVTGFLVGGISPVGQRRQLDTRIEERARRLSKIYVSGGRRGLELGLAPGALLEACHRGAWAPLCIDSH
ncbi:MAG: Cys-tRNA(Pro) deacylase [Myxococcota bacterium]